MNDEVFNLELRKFLKQFGVTSLDAGCLTSAEPV